MLASGVAWLMLTLACWLLTLTFVSCMDCLVYWMHGRVTCQKLCLTELQLSRS